MIAASNAPVARIPHVFVILVMIVIFATAMTYIIPAGEFARVKNEATGKMIVDARPLSHGLNNVR